MSEKKVQEPKTEEDHKDIKKNRKRILTEYYVTLFLIAVFISITVGSIYLGLQGYFNGFHNMDLAQNMRYIETSFNVTLMDQYGLDGNQTLTSVQGYILGTIQLRLALPFLFIGFSFLGVCYCLLMNYLDENKKLKLEKLEATK